MNAPKLDPQFGTWRMRAVVKLASGNRERIAASGDTKTKCREEFDRKRREAEEADARGPVKPVKGGKVFATFAGEWLERYPAAVRNRASTIIEKRYHVDVRILPYFAALAAARGGAPYTLAEITPAVIDAFLAHLATALSLRGKKPLSAKSAQNVTQTLRRMLRTAVRWGELDAAPEVPRPKAPKAEIDFCDFDEADRLVAAATDSEDRALVLTALRAGPRAGELLGLQWSAVDFHRKEIRIDKQVDENGTIQPPKAGSRTVPMSGKLAAALQAIRHLRGPFVFCDADGRPHDRGHLRRLMRRLTKKAGLRHLHPHVLRHTFASHLAMRGVPLVQIQKWLGHTSITMTMRYAHLAPGSGAHMIDALDAPARTG